MGVFARAYLGALVAFCLMDALWLGLIATEFYFGALGGLLEQLQTLQGTGAIDALDGRAPSNLNAGRFPFFKPSTFA